MIHVAVIHGAVIHGAVILGAVIHGAVIHGAVIHGAAIHGAVIHGAVIIPRRQAGQLRGAIGLRFKEEGALGHHLIPEGEPMKHLCIAMASRAKVHGCRHKAVVTDGF